MTTRNSDLFVGQLTAAEVRSNQQTGSGIGFGLVLGFFVVALLPAAFWTGVVYGVGAMFGTAVSPIILTSVFTVIALFLGIIFAAIARTSGTR